MPTSTLNKADWDLLVGRIKDGKCTPFLGAGACAGVLPLAREIAQKWADEYDYPLSDTTNLIQVAQFLAVQTQESRSQRICSSATLVISRPTSTALLKFTAS